MYMISVIVPVHNMEKNIKNCVESILNQTFREFELILVDDGSTDKGPEICDQYQCKYSQIKVIHKENRGVSSARNCGIEHAKGKYLLFVDADDLIHPQMLQLFFEAAEKENADICMGGTIEADEFKTSMFQKCEGNYRCIEKKRDRLKNIYLSDKYKYWVAWGKMYKRETFNEKIFEVGKNYEDNGLIFELLYNANKIIDFEDKLYFYYRNPRGITKGDFSLKSLDIMWAFEKQLIFLQEHQENWMTREIFYRYLNICAELYFKTKNKMFTKQVSQEIKCKLNMGMQKWGNNYDFAIDEIPNVYKIVYPRKYYLYMLRKKINERLEWIKN